MYDCSSEAKLQPDDLDERRDAHRDQHVHPHRRREAVASKRKSIRGSEDEGREQRPRHRPRELHQHPRPVLAQLTAQRVAGGRLKHCDRRRNEPREDDERPFRARSNEPASVVPPPRRRRLDSGRPIGERRSRRQLSPRWESRSMSLEFRLDMVIRVKKAARRHVCHDHASLPCGSRWWGCRHRGRAWPVPSASVTQREVSGFRSGALEERSIPIREASARDLL